MGCGLKAPLNSIHIAAVLLLVSTRTLGVSADQPGGTSDRAKVLDSATSLALAYTRRLPDFICTQITHRDVSGVSNASGGVTGIDAVPILSAATSSSSVIEERLTFFDQKENYEVITIDGHKVTGAKHLENGGAISAGEFGTALRDIFDPQSHTVFTWGRMDKMHGTQVYVFVFHVPKERGALVTHRDPDQQIVVPYAGEIFVDSDTSEVMRITSRLDLPSKFPIQMAERRVDYKQTTIAGKSYNLPSHSEVRMEDSSNLYVNGIDFKDYHKFVVDSTIHYNGSPQQ